VAIGKTQKKVFVEDEDGERLERATPSKPLTGRPVPPPAPTARAAFGRPPQIDMGADAASGTMALDNVPELPPLPPPPAEGTSVGVAAVALGAKVTVTGDMRVVDAPFGTEVPAGASLPAPGDVEAPASSGQPGPVVERDTKPDKPGAKGSKR